MTEMVAGWNGWPLWRHVVTSAAPGPPAEPPRDWEEVGIDVAKEVVRQAELNLQQQAAVAQSIDQRATSLAGLANAGAVAVLVFLASQIAQAKADAALSMTCVVIVTVWWASAAASYTAMAPSEWRSAGFWPSQLYRSLTDGNWTLAQRLGSLAEQLDVACRINDSRN